MRLGGYVSKFEDRLLEEAKKEEQEQASVLVGTPISLPNISTETTNKDWVWEDYIARGYVTLLSALYKAGKSTLLRCLLSAMQNEEEFAGRPTKKTKILIITEEAEGEWAEKREDFGLEDAQDILIWSRPIRVKPNLKQWVGITEELSQLCIKEQIGLIVIDTLTTFWPIDNENDSAQVIKALIPLYSFTQNNIAVLVVHHFRKEGGTEGRASRGSGALPGFVDNIIEFTRVEGTNFRNTQRLIRTYGRFDQVIPEVVIELTPDNKYIFKGSRWEVSKTAKIERLVQVFEENEEALNTKDIQQLWDDTRFGETPNLRTLQRYIKELLDKNILAVVREEVVVRKNTPFYALKGQYKEQMTIAFPLGTGSVVSSVNDQRQSPRSLSSVDDQNEATTEETTVARVTEKQFKEPDPIW